MKPVRNHLKLFAAAACFLLAAATGFSSDEKTAAFPFYKDIILSEHQGDIFTFTVDADIYRETAEIPRDMRIFGPDGENCPFILSEQKQAAQENTVESSCSTTVTGFETLPDGSVRISTSMNSAFSDSADPRVVGLTIRTAAKDFDKKVKIFDKTGETLIAEGAFLDYSSRVNLRNDSIRFPAPTREFSFVIVMDNYTEIKDSPRFRVVEGDSSILEQEKYRESPKIDGISLQVVRNQKSMSSVSASSPVEIISKTKRDKTTVVTFSNGFAPLHTITVDNSDAFFSRPYRLYNASGKLLASGIVRKLDSASFRTSVSDRVIRISENRSKTWTLELDNGEYGELKDIALQASGPVNQIRFLALKPAAASGETSPSGYRIYYGSSGQLMPPSDFTDVLRNMKEPVVSDSTLSEQKENPGFNESAAPAYPRDWGLVYKIIMAAAALAVFVILILSVKKIDKVED